MVRHHLPLGGVAIRRVDLLPRSQAVPYAYSIDVGITPVSGVFSISILTTLPVLSKSMVTPGPASPLQTLGAVAYHKKRGRILKRVLTSNHRTPLQNQDAGRPARPSASVCERSRRAGEGAHTRAQTARRATSGVRRMPDAVTYSTVVGAICAPYLLCIQ